MACLGGSLCVGSVVQADSPTTVKANPVVPTAMVAQVQSTQPTNSTAATNTIANTVAANSEPAKAAVVLDEQTALKQKQQYQAETETMGLLWMRTSAEYRALAYQGYNVALNIVKMAVYDPSDRKSTRLNSSHIQKSRMPSSA